ncbi:hypothetical protein VIGAN_02152000 [Vigna angularis var. angularis]|uniref:Uncharacterized protein n=1 Tax=Vigna angularis var. angularis TaxID=157739 RepID=A0A0S3RDY4_PHAAN|nr:hypothetical protein VIGAN_02152000 [Vigna angularis var. angularis]
MLLLLDVSNLGMFILSFLLSSVPFLIFPFQDFLLSPAPLSSLLMYFPYLQFELKTVPSTCLMKCNTTTTSQLK